MSKVEREIPSSLACEAQYGTPELQEKIRAFARADLEDLVIALFEAHPDTFVPTATAFIRRPKPAKPTGDWLADTPTRRTPTARQLHLNEPVGTPAAESPAPAPTLTPTSLASSDPSSSPLVASSCASVAAPTPTPPPLSSSTLSASSCASASVATSTPTLLPSSTHLPVWIPLGDVAWALTPRGGTSCRSMNSSLLPKGRRLRMVTHAEVFSSPTRRCRNPSSHVSPRVSSLLDLKIALSPRQSLSPRSKNITSLPDLKVPADLRKKTPGGNLSAGRLSRLKTDHGQRRIQAAADRKLAVELREGAVLSTDSKTKANVDLPPLSQAAYNSAPGAVMTSPFAKTKSRRATPRATLHRGMSVEVASQDTAFEHVITPTSVFESDSDFESDPGSASDEGVARAASTGASSAVPAQVLGRPWPRDVTPATAATPNEVDLGPAPNGADAVMSESKERRGVTSRNAAPTLPDRPTRMTSPEATVTPRRKAASLNFPPAVRTTTTTPLRRNPHGALDVAAVLGSLSCDVTSFRGRPTPIPTRDLAAERSSSRRSDTHSDHDQGGARSLLDLGLHRNARLNLRRNAQATLHVPRHLQVEAHRRAASANGNVFPEPWSDFCGSDPIGCAPEARDQATTNRRFAELSGMQPKEFFEAVLVHPFFALEALHQCQLRQKEDQD